MKQIRMCMIPLALVFLLAGCAQSDPAGTVENYFQALVDHQEGEFFDLVCADWESRAAVDFDSFSAVDASLNDLSCTSASESGGTAEVMCQGNITVAYDGESNELLDLTEYTFDAVQENGIWRMCGYR